MDMPIVGISLVLRIAAVKNGQTVPFTKEPPLICPVPYGSIHTVRFDGNHGFIIWRNTAAAEAYRKALNVDKIVAIIEECDLNTATGRTEDLIPDCPPEIRGQDCMMSLTVTTREFRRFIKENAAKLPNGLAEIIPLSFLN